jgi:hypothetical protein
MGRVWKFKIIGHKRVQPSDPDYMGSMYNVQLLWETGEVSWDYTRRTRPACTTPTSYRCHLREKHGLLDTPGWKLRDSRNEPRPRNDLSAALTKQSYIRSLHQTSTCCSSKVRDYEQAVSIDEQERKWQDSTEKYFVD